MELIEILKDVARSRQELAALTDLDPARLQFCDDVISRLENELEVTILKPWIPTTYPKVQCAIIGTMQRIEETEQLIVDAAPTVLVNKQPDEMLRLGIAQLSLSTLRFQLQTLFEAAAHLYNKFPPSHYEMPYGVD